MKVDFVGSFLAPIDFFEKRENYFHGEIDRETFERLADKAIAGLVDDELKAGLTEVSSGEFRRKSWDKDFFFGLDGITVERLESGHLYTEETVLTDLMRITGRIGYNPEHPFFSDFEFLKETTAGRAVCRQTIPSPAELYMRILMMTDGHPERIYPSPETLLDDIAEAYNRTIRRFYELGCRSLQLDDTVCGRLSDDSFMKELLQGGIDPIALQGDILALFNKSIEGISADMELSVYLSAGDTVVPQWHAVESPDNFMPRLLSSLNVSRFYMPFNTGAPESVEIVKYIPAGKKLVMGVVDAHSPFPDNHTLLMATISEALLYISPDKVFISPKTGFKVSSFDRRGLTYEDQWHKLGMLSELAASF